MRRIKNRLGICIWFDDSSGEGMILDLGTGLSLYCHYSSIRCNDPFKTMAKHDVVIFDVYRNVYMCQVEKVRILEPDFDYQIVNNALEMMFERGINILSQEPKYA